MMVDLPSYGPTSRVRLGSFLRSRPLLLNYTGNKTLSDFQVKCILTSHDISFAKLRADKQDLLFVDNNNEPIPYWIEKANNTEITVWLKFSKIIPGGEVFWLYYGNGNFSGMSNVSATFVRVINGLVGSWHLDESSGNIAYDSSGQGNNGTIYGATWTDGKFGKALDFDGVDDYIEIIHDGSLYVWQGNSPATFEAWVKPLFDIPPSNIRSALQFKDSAGTGRTILYIHKSGNFYSHFGGAGLDSGVSAVKGQFTHVILRYDGSVLKFFIDGVGAGADSRNVDEGAVGAFLLGTHKSLADWWQGVIDEVRIYNRALSAEEISDLYNNYGYTTTNYPGKVLVRKYTEVEPFVSK